ncbi:type VI secretion system tube protein TssD [Aquimarina rhabdastrellae]
MVSAKLFVLKQERELLWIDTNYYREISHVSGRPATEVMGGLLRCSFTPERGDDIFLNWMLKDSTDDSGQEKDKMEEGKICFYEKGFDYPATKTYKFNDAFLIAYEETFSTIYGMQAVLTISPGIQDYGAYFLKRWNVSHVSKENEPYAPQEEKKPEVLKCYYTDLEGNKKASPITGEEIYVVLETRNAIGETIDIDLSNHTKDFIYNNEIIENDIIKDYIVNSNVEKIKVRVIAQQEGDRDSIKN